MKGFLIMKKRQPKNTIRWSWNEYVTYPEFIKRLEPLVCGPIHNLNEMEGDMYLSDYRKLQSAFWKLHNAVEELKGESV